MIGKPLGIDAPVAAGTDFLSLLLDFTSQNQSCLKKRQVDAHYDLGLRSLSSDLIH